MTACDESLVLFVLLICLTNGSTVMESRPSWYKEVDSGLEDTSEALRRSSRLMVVCTSDRAFLYPSSVMIWLTLWFSV